jgi:hypothetical protein
MLLAARHPDRAGGERAWYFFRIGATPFPDSQFPVEAFDARL